MDIAMALSILSLVLAIFTEETKVAKNFLFNKSGNLGARIKLSRESFIKNYSENAVFRSHSNVIAIKSLIMAVVYFISIPFLAIFNVVLSIQEIQLNERNLTLTPNQSIVAYCVFFVLFAVYLFSASYRMSGHNQALKFAPAAPDSL